MSGLELIRRFSIMFPLDKMIMIWPTVRKCRVSREVADWVLLTHDPSIPIKDQQIIPYQEKCAELIAMVRKEPNNELIHSLTLYRLVRRLNPFKGIFSGAAQQIELAKDRLLATLGSVKEFELLEKALPEQLHIEALCPSHRESLYARVLLNRSGTEMAQKAEHRFAISLLLGYFKLRLAVKLNVGTTQATDTRMALGVMRSQVYSKIDDAEGLCWMMHLVKFVDGGGSFILPPEPLILDCIVNDAQVPQFKQIRERIRKWHYEFLSSVENGIPLVSVFTKRSVAGTVTRLKRLLGKKLFDKLCAKYPQMCQYPGDVFEDDKILTSFYRNAILNANSFPEIERISAKLAADIIVFVRWFDAEPKGQYICEYWHKQREELMILYDNVFDENFTDVYGIGSAIYIFELTSGVLKQFLITHRHCDQPQVLKVVWQKLVKQLETESERLYSAGGKEKQEQQRHNPIGTEVRKWLNQLHANQLKRIFLNQEPMVKTNGEEHGKTEEKYDPIAEFATLMKKGLSSMMEARILLCDFVGTKEVDNILKIIGIESKFDDLNDALLGKENGTNTGESSKNNKKKKKKAKRSKKEKNGEKENGKDTKNTSEDKISQDKVSTFDDTNDNGKGDRVSTKNRECQLSEDKVSTKNWEDQLNWLARTLLSNGEMANDWDKLGKDSQTQAITHPEVHSLQRIQSNWVPLIRLKVINFDHEIDIVFASIPGEQQIDADDLRQQNILTKFEEMIEKLDNKIKQLKEEEDRNDQASLTNAKEQMLKSLRSLAGYHSNLKLLEMVKKNNNFHKLLLVLKLWAKSNYIYNNAMGFFNGTSLGVLAAKIVLLYPEATVPFLLERFFFTYSSWEWPLPVQIAEIRPNSSLNWNAWDEQNHLLSQYGSGGAYSKLMIPTWLVGVKKMNDTQIKRQQGQVGGDLQQNDNKLKQELDEVIVNSYKSIVLRGGRRGGANLNLAEQKIQKHFARNNLFQGTDETDNQRDFVNLESKYVDKQIHSS
ncbi:hypothetical protein niasHS_016571 [Heterodera schachtii]|uniref:polynucleotide adenylyltransferase n=1 Tax=Heterodera schachtii TaxID=97005 RepID=A0ABD2HXN0_HETSC